MRILSATALILVVSVTCSLGRAGQGARTSVETLPASTELPNPEQLHNAVGAFPQWFRPDFNRPESRR
jgi:hypothetical protein